MIFILKNISIIQAALGAVIEVPTLHGKVELTIQKVRKQVLPLE